MGQDLVPLDLPWDWAEDPNRPGHWRRVDPHEAYVLPRGTRIATTAEMCRRGIVGVILEVPPGGAQVDGLDFRPGLVTVQDAHMIGRLVMQGCRVDSLRAGTGRVPAWW
jgi:hypothetical protein